MGKEWRKRLKPYAQANHRKAWFQILNTVVPYFVLLGLMGTTIIMGLPYWLTFLMAIPTGAFMVRSFILFHDCTHMSFLKTAKANRIMGHLLSIIVFTPYTIWQSEHNKHHGAVGNLDDRGVGDVWTMTVEEYDASSSLIKLKYRIFRHPVFLFFIAPFLLFGIRHRLPSRKFTSKEHHISHMITNAGILLFAVVTGMTIGLKNYFLIQLPVLYFASTMGVWLFFVQHQFEEVYWERHGEWDLVKASIEGSSFYKLPLVLEWVSGYIGYHHIHHLNPRIPNYHLKKCYRDIHEFKNGRTIEFLESFKLALLNLYDEKNNRLIRIRDLKKYRLDGSL